MRKYQYFMLLLLLLGSDFDYTAKPWVIGQDFMAT
jgi:hypothetical protein